MNFLSRHALALDDQSRRAFARKSLDDFVCFGSVAGPMNPGARLFRIRSELFQISVEMKKCLVLDVARLCSQVFPIRQTLRRRQPAFAEQ